MSTYVGVLNFNNAVDRAAKANLDLMRRTFQRTALMMIGSVVVGDPGYSPGTPVGNPSLWKHPAPPGYVGGFARASWYTFVAEGAGGSPAIGEVGANSDPVAQADAAITDAHLGHTIWEVNGAPYAVALEFGHSTQAPAGMVRMTLSASQEIVNAALAIERGKMAA